MNYLFELSHPKHYYQFRAAINQLNKTNNVFIIARDKDVLLNVLDEENVDYEVYGKHGKTILAKLTLIPSLLFSYYKLLKHHKIDVVISKASAYAAVICQYLKIKTIIFPDSEIVSLTNKFVAPRSTKIVTPANFKLNFGPKHVKVAGLFEDCYLHPTVFTPSKVEVEEMGFDLSKPYFILRFISWNANHDINNFGFSEGEKLKLVETLKNYGNVYISGEAKLPSQFQQYKINIPASKIHHVMHYADMYIGDSQTMATEAALLGTPAIRFNSFVGVNDMSNFKMLEDEFELLKNFNDFENLMDCVERFMNDSENKLKWIKKRELYYDKIGDVNKQMRHFIDSVSIQS
jgi:predicted glycosyltransferase